MNLGVKTIIYPVRDLTAAKAIFGALLGVEPTSDYPQYVGYELAGQQIGLNPSGHDYGQTGPVPYWHVEDMPATLQALIAAGATVSQEPTPVGGGRIIASLKDADDNPIGLIYDEA